MTMALILTVNSSFHSGVVMNLRIGQQVFEEFKEEDDFWKHYEVEVIHVL